MQSTGRAPQATSVQASAYSSIRARVAITNPANHVEMTSVQGAQYLYEADRQSASRGNLNVSNRPSTSGSNPSSQLVKRKVSRSAIASDSDARNIQALSDFLRDKEPPPTSFTSIPDDDKQEQEQGSSNWLSMLGRLSRRNSTLSLRGVRSTKSTKSTKGKKQPLQLPDSAVAMKTSKGGHWHIAICVSGDEAVPPLPRLDEVKNPHAIELLSRTISRATTHDTISVKSPSNTVSKSIKSQRTIIPRLSGRSIRSTVARSFRRKSAPDHTSELRMSSRSNKTALRDPIEPVQQASLTGEAFENQKHEIAAAIAGWEQGSSEFDLTEFLLRLAALASKECSIPSSQRDSIYTSTSSMDPEMDLWRNRTVSMSSEISEDIKTLRNQLQKVSSVASEKTVKIEDSKADLQAKSVGENHSSILEPAQEPPRRASIESMLSIRHQDSAETIRIERKSNVAILQAPVVQSINSNASHRDISEQVAPRQESPRSNLEQTPLHMSDSPVEWQEESEKLWQPTTTLAPAQSVAHLIIALKPKPKPTLWQPASIPTPPASDSASDGELEYMPDDLQSAPATETKPTPIDSRSMFEKETRPMPGGFPSTPATEIELTLVNFPPMPEKETEPMGFLSTTEKQAEPKSFGSKLAPAAEDEFSEAKDQKISEISRCLLELQQQNAVMMEALAALTNRQDMALFEAKLETMPSAVKHERVKSDLIEF